MGLKDTLLGTKQPRLSVEEAAELQSCVAVVRQGLAAFVEVGKALLRIKTKQLYRQAAATFEEFADREFGLTGRRLNQIIDAAGVCADIMLARPDLPQPRSENQMRPLVGLSADKAVEAWVEAVEESGGNIPGGKAISKAANKRKPTRKKKGARVPKAIRLRVPGATVLITPNKAFESPVAALQAALDQLQSKAAA